MPARQMRQDQAIKELFRRRIREKVAREKAQMKGRIDEAIPSWISWALKPVADVMFDSQRRRDNAKGQRGEGSAGIGFWLWLGKEWVELDDVVIEPEQGEFAQIDHVLIGPPGVCLVETKTWDGVFTAYRDGWRRKEGNRWVNCESPIRQNQQHLKLFERWARTAVGGRLPAGADASPWLFGAVLIYRAKWLKVTECTMPIYQAATDLVWELKRRQKRQPVLGPDQVDAVALALSRAAPFGQVAGEAAAAEVAAARPLEGSPLPPTSPPSAAPSATPPHPSSSASPLPAPANVRAGRSPDGRNYARVTGSRDDAEKVRALYALQGRQTGSVRGNPSDDKDWLFYWE